MNDLEAAFQRVADSVTSLTQNLVELYDEIQAMKGPEKQRAKFSILDHNTGELATAETKREDMRVWLQCSACEKLIRELAFDEAVDVSKPIFCDECSAMQGANVVRIPGNA